MNIFITGIAGFIGFHVAKILAKENHYILGIDSLNDYYNQQLKYDRLSCLGIKINENNIIINSNTIPNLSFLKSDLLNKDDLRNAFNTKDFEIVIHLAAQAGVRYSITNPDSYIQNNIQGFLNLLEIIKEKPVRHLIYASSSSVYGFNITQPFSEQYAVDHPASLYAVTKRSNELMAYCYSHLYNIPSTGLRFFTVYGPWGRPDMALFLFTKSILENKPIDVFNYGNMKRDFTYIDDIVTGIISLIDHVPNSSINLQNTDTNTSSGSHRIYNIGKGSPVLLLDFINLLEKELGKKAKLNFLPLQPGDVPSTWADCTNLEKEIGYHSSTDIKMGIKYFVNWYKYYYKIK
jgi:UDP-glucuronate 4-epimerase